MQGVAEYFPAALVVYDTWFVWPRIQTFRQEYIDHADEPDVANPAKEQFDRYHQESVHIRNILTNDSNRQLYRNNFSFQLFFSVHPTVYI